MGFGWWKSAKTAEQLPEHLQRVLQQFSHDALPLPLPELLVSTQYSESAIELVLPFAAKSVHVLLSQAFADAGFKGTLTLSSVNQIDFSFKSIRQIVLVASGKGGVGKSTVATNIALALVKAGKKVGLLDIDLCGPSIPRLVGLQGRDVKKCSEVFVTNSNLAHSIRWVPVFPDHTQQLAVMSIGFLLPDTDAAVIWRGPKKTGIVMLLLLSCSDDQTICGRCLLGTIGLLNH
ncbi:MAG: P-loop NTPase [Gammaproteobacteria bacterium]|nr:P-loop NTPase [Gammaproteobacteria bacterium]